MKGTRGTAGLVTHLAGLTRGALARSNRIARHAERRLLGSRAVLGYHRVAEATTDPWALAVSPLHFDQHLSVLRQLGTIDKLTSVLDAAFRDRVGAGRTKFALTFDDGYVDNLREAVAILERHDAPATVFIATGMIDGATYWWDVLAELVFVSDCSLERLIDAAAQLGLFTSDDQVGVGDRRATHRAIHSSLIKLPTGAIPAVLAQLADALNVPTPKPAARPMSTDELLELAEHPLVSIGVHTVTHPRLPLLSDSQIRAEFEDSVAVLDKLLGSEQRALAYPYGATSAGVAQVARSTGFQHAVTTEPRWLSVRDDVLRAPRLHPHDLPGEAFRSWLTASSRE